MSIPATDYRTALAVRNDTRMTEVTVTFTLTSHQGASASYAAVCPRCHTGEITVDVALAPDGSFAAPPACPTLCLACEDRLDRMLEPSPAKKPGDQPGDRATLGAFLKAMNIRPWD
jgi:hypothetical protein